MDITIWKHFKWKLYVWTNSQRKKNSRLKKNREHNIIIWTLFSEKVFNFHNGYFFCLYSILVWFKFNQHELQHWIFLNLLPLPKSGEKEKNDWEKKVTTHSTNIIIFDLQNFRHIYKFCICDFIKLKKAKNVMYFYFSLKTKQLKKKRFHSL